MAFHIMVNFSLIHTFYYNKKDNLLYNYWFSTVFLLFFNKIGDISRNGVFRRYLEGDELIDFYVFNRFVDIYL